MILSPKKAQAQAQSAPPDHGFFIRKIYLAKI